MKKVSVNILKQRSDFFRKVRDFFYRHDFIEIDTPSLVEYASTEPHLDPYEVITENGCTEYLITSPEYAMKKVLGMGCEKVFELSHAWRSKEKGPWHTREFIMLEWYWVGAELDVLIQMSIEFIKECLGELKNVHILTVEEWFKKQYGCGCDTNDLESILKDKDVDCEGMSYEEKFFRCFLPTESHFKSMGLVVLKDYPEPLKAYSRVVDGKAKRFEMYLHGVEIANAFFEEKSPEALNKIIDTEMNERKELGKNPIGKDIEFVHCLEKIEKPISGIALGLDRLFALSLGYQGLELSCLYEQNI